MHSHSGETREGLGGGSTEQGSSYSSGKLSYFGLGDVTFQAPEKGRVDITRYEVKKLVGE